ncbi:MAG: hypothetical protein ACK5L4_06465, partial [Pseudanabaena sp.]
LGASSWGLREEQDSSYGDRVISSTPFYAGVAFIVWLSLPHVLTDQCREQLFFGLLKQSNIVINLSSI